MKKYVLERSTQRVVLRLTTTGRWSLGLQTGATATSLTLLGLAFFYLPDFVADYSRRGEDFTSFFGMYLLGVAGFVGLVAGIMRGLGDYTWTLDYQEGLVRWWSRTPFGRIVTDELEVDRIDSASVVRTSGWWPRQQLIVRLDDGEDAVVAFSSSNLDELCAAITEALDATSSTN